VDPQADFRGRRLARVGRAARVCSVVDRRLRSGAKLPPHIAQPEQDVGEPAGEQCGEHVHVEGDSLDDEGAALAEIDHVAPRAERDRRRDQNDGERRGGREPPGNKWLFDP
jgi:hypothetical protein